MEHRSNEDSNTNNTEDSAYQGIVDTIMAELQHKYNIMSKTKNVTTTQPKKILPRGEIYDPTQKETEIQNTKIKGAEIQTGRTETVETKTTENKSIQTNKSEKKETEVPIRETKKI